MATDDEEVAIVLGVLTTFLIGLIVAQLYLIWKKENTLRRFCNLTRALQQRCGTLSLDDWKLRFYGYKGNNEANIVTVLELTDFTSDKYDPWPPRESSPNYDAEKERFMRERMAEKEEITLRSSIDLAQAVLDQRYKERLAARPADLIRRPV